MNYELAILQLVRLRGRPTLPDIATGVGLTPNRAEATVREFLTAGKVEQFRDRLRITEAGRAALADLITQERLGVDQQRLESAYERFTPINAQFKQLVTDWQMIDGSRPNDHTNPDYDAAVISRLGELHNRFSPLLAQLAEIAPRLANYPARFDAALDKIRAGDHTWFARPLIDSYHTAWFELHEDLIGLAGRTRAEEALAGRAE
ncbi:hypothetical protein AB0M12_37970 [Nocardia vinacea]|uniref:hypothetical protein n=1 Tax=Nocardia vinacea TaxID=96468 RepID=UPI003433B0FC